MSLLYILHVNMLQYREYQNMATWQVDIVLLCIHNHVSKESYSFSTCNSGI